MWTGRVCLFGLLCLTASLFCGQQQVNALLIRGPFRITIMRRSHRQEHGDRLTSLALSGSNRSEGRNAPRNHPTPQPTPLFQHPGLDRKSKDNSIDHNDSKETPDPRLLDPAFNLQRRHEQQRRFPPDDQDTIDDEDDPFPARNWDGTINKGWQRIV